MATNFYPGCRLSYAGATCTVRYTGPVRLTKGSWLGVEWDDPSRGKHNGSHDGVRYFDCQSPSPTAGSFVRPNRLIDGALSFLDALRRKYVSPDVSASEETIQISGKTVEEIGFHKVAAQLATLHELRIVLLDGLCVRGVLDRPCLSVQELVLQERQRIEDQTLKIQELDLSRNLIEEWADVVGICSTLRFLTVLQLDGNRFRDLLLPEKEERKDAFPAVRELSLASTFLTWDKISTLLLFFPTLTSLSLASNNLSSPPLPLPTPHLTTLTLTANVLTSLSSLTPLTTLPNLHTLILRSNPLASLTSPTPFPSLSTLDLTSTSVPSPSSLNPLLEATPKLSSLLTTHTPLHSTPSSHLQTIARLPTLTSLNHSKISPPERTNAELYYLSTIASSLSSTPADAESSILQDHPRYVDLCALHGAPTIKRKPIGNTPTGGEPPPGSVAARLITFTLYRPSSDPAQEARETVVTLPRTIGVYALKGIVGRLFGLKPMSLTLIWETGEWDPVAGADDRDEDSDLEQDVASEKERREVEGKGEEKEERDKGRWVQREEELVDGTKDVGFWVEGREARVRIEMR